MLDEQKVKRIPAQGTLKKYCDINKAFNENCEAEKQWLFRGQKREDRTFKTSLKRAVLSQGKMREIPIPDDKEQTALMERKALRDGLDLRFLRSRSALTVSEVEKGLLRRFKRQCYHYLSDTPREGEILEWLALMQHHGAPTRLLDWTWSFPVALFFALEKAAGDSAVWAIDSGELQNNIPQSVSAIANPDAMRDEANFRSVLQEGHNFVFKVSPFRLNKRLVIQQGAFLAPGNIEQPFDDNLSSSIREGSGALLKFVIDGGYTARRDLLYELHRNNVNAATLFPDLDGFARSLEQLLAFPDVIPPESNWGK